MKRRALLIAGAASCSPFVVWAQRTDELISLDDVRGWHDYSQVVLIDRPKHSEHAVTECH